MNILQKNKFFSSNSKNNLAPATSGDFSNNRIKIYESYQKGYFIGQNLYEQEIDKRAKKGI